MPQKGGIDIASAWVPDDKWLRENGLDSQEAEQERLKKLFGRFGDVADFKGSGVLLGPELVRLNKIHKIIDPIQTKHVGPAKYQLTVGAAVKRVRGELEYLRSSGDSFTIGPYEAVQIQTEETLNLPRNLIARWNIRVDLANKGLLWVGAPQVDPGWRGRLFPPIYNLSGSTVTLRRGDKFATMDFVTTTPYSGPSGQYDYPRDRAQVTIKSEVYQPINSALHDSFTKIEQHEALLKKQQDLMTQQEDRQAVSNALVTTILAIFVATLAATVGHLSGVTTGYGLFGVAAGTMVVVAVVLISLAKYLGLDRSSKKS